MSPDENTFGFIASEEDESSSEIILQTETTGLGPIQIFSYSKLLSVRDSGTATVLSAWWNDDCQNDRHLSRENTIFE